MQPLVTIFCAFTRRWAVERWLDNLAAVAHDPAQTNLAFIIDSDEPYIANQINKFASSRPYRSLELVMNREHNPNEVRIAIRRARIAEVKNQSKELIRRHPSQFVIGLEDDTVFNDPETFHNLIRPLEVPTPSGGPIGFVEGVQRGRWGANMIGAWRFDDITEPNWAETLLLGSVLTYEDIGAGGFYGYATPAELYLNHDYHWQPDQPWGPDVNYGLWLKQQGYRCLIHWPTHFGHNDHNVIGWPDEKIGQVCYAKNTYGKWERQHDKESS